MKNPLSNLMKPRCIHRHSADTHPKCFNADGTPKTVAQLKTDSQLPKVLVFDIETSLSEAYVWGPGEQYVGPNQIKRDWFVLGWSAKWLFDTKVMSAVLTPDEAKKGDDSRIIKEIWNLLDKSQIVIGHNISHFDVPKLNARFLYYGLNPPMYYQMIDTLPAVRRVFKLTSNKLDEITKFLGLGEKGHPGWDCWVACSNGDAEALKAMQKYNENDSVIEEEMYLKIRPWIKSHPNMGLYIETTEPVCSICGSTELSWGELYQGTYRMFRCKCGAVGRSKINELSKEKRASLTKGV